MERRSGGAIGVEWFTKDEGDVPTVHAVEWRGGIVGLEPLKVEVEEREDGVVVDGPMEEVFTETGGGAETGNGGALQVGVQSVGGVGCVERDHRHHLELVEVGEAV